MTPKPRPANQAAFAFVHKHWDDLPEDEQNDVSTALLEQYLTGSDSYRLNRKLIGRPLSEYITRRAAQYYADHYKLRDNTTCQSIRLRLGLEVALLGAMGWPVCPPPSDWSRAGHCMLKYANRNHN